MTKRDVLTALQAQLTEKIAVLKSALAESNENASGEETRSEGTYDTRAIEASYLAEAQREQLSLAEQSLALFETFEPTDFQPTDAIAPGALVEADQDGEICFYLLAPTGGGLVTDYLGCDVTVITPDSRLYQELLEKKMGEEIDQPALTILGVE
ncbi:MAG: hypothetical protein PVJ98_06745 [Akkermansiaceae bacterium]|jgi:hypothetical protein